MGTRFLASLTEGRNKKKQDVWGERREEKKRIDTNLKAALKVLIYKPFFRRSTLHNTETENTQARKKPQL